MKHDNCKDCISNCEHAGKDREFVCIKGITCKVTCSASNQLLIIDGENLGRVIGYRQNRDLKRWVFLMEKGYYIGVDFSNIKLFESGAALIITTYQGD